MCLHTRLYIALHGSASVAQDHGAGAFSGRRGYLLTQVAGGVWADKFGGKPILGFGVIWWSVATALTPIAAQLGLPVSPACPQVMMHKSAQTKPPHVTIIAQHDMAMPWPAVLHQDSCKPGQGHTTQT